MSERPLPTPEGRVITAALTKSGMSAREAARRANISEGRWRQITSGYMTVRAGVYAAVTDAPADTLARMAKAVGAAPEAFEAAGRPDVAEAMRRDQTSTDAEPPGEAIDLNTYVPQTPVERALLAIYQTDRRAREVAEEALQRLLRELNDKVDRLSSHTTPEDGNGNGNGQSDDRQLGA